MIEILSNWDRDLFLFLNGLGTESLDPIFYWISAKSVWIPLYLFFIYLLFKHYDKREASVLLVAVLMSVGATDYIAAKGIKPSVGRWRPSHNLEIGHQVHLVKKPSGEVYKGGRYSFVSNHAANTFGLATFLFIFLRRKIQYFSLSIFSWAGIVSYSRIYLGVHYPGDIIAGALFGMLMASIFAILALKVIQKIHIKDIQKLTS